MYEHYIMQVDEFLRCSSQAEKKKHYQTSSRSAKKHLKENHTVLINITDITECLKVKFVSSLLFHKLSEASESMVFAFHFQFFFFFTLLHLNQL